MIASPMGAAIHNPQAANHPPLPQSAYNSKDWYINPKVHVKDFPTFDSKPDTYRFWSARIKDHLASCHPPWVTLLELVEKDRTPMTFARMRNMRAVDNVWINLPEIAINLYSFLGMHLGSDTYMRRPQLVDGEEGNGIELWRKLYLQNEGGAEQVYLMGLNRFMTFQKCPHRNQLATYLGEWEILRLKYGSTFNDVVLYTMLINILPEDIAKEVRDRRQTLNTVSRVLDYLKAELGRFNDSYLSRVHSQQDAKALEKGPKNPVNAVLEQQLATLNSSMQRLCAAFNNRSPPRTPGGGGGGAAAPSG